MDAQLMLIPTGMMNKLAVSEIVECNKITLRYGLMLSPAEAGELVETRAEALRGHGRIEFSGGLIKKLILRFCDSPFLSQHDYAAVLNDLIETFYYFKNEALDELTDDELLSWMRRYFDHTSRGSVELLQNRDLEILARNIRYGISDFANLSEAGDNAFDEENYDE